MKWLNTIAAFGQTIYHHLFAEDDSDSASDDHAESNMEQPHAPRPATSKLSTKIEAIEGKVTDLHQALASHLGEKQEIAKQFDHLHQKLDDLFERGTQPTNETAANDQHHALERFRTAEKRIVDQLEELLGAGKVEQLAGLHQDIDQLLGKLVAHRNELTDTHQQLVSQLNENQHRLKELKSHLPAA